MGSLLFVFVDFAACSCVAVAAAACGLPWQEFEMQIQVETSDFREQIPKTYRIAGSWKVFPFLLCFLRRKAAKAGPPCGVGFRLSHSGTSPFLPFGRWPRDMFG